MSVSDITGKDGDDLNFIEEAVEVECSDAILVVLSDGSVYSVFENIACEMIARPAAKAPIPNLIEGQLLSLSNNMLINLKNDRASELYRYVDKKLSLMGTESMGLKSVAQTKVLQDG